MTSKMDWRGAELLLRANRAAGRAIVAIGTNVAVETKGVTHVVEGNLRRSVHAAAATADHGLDESEAATADLMLTRGPPEPELTPLGPAVEVGSWLPYACVEWVGRGHPGVTQGLEAVRGERVNAIVRAAFGAEGL